MYSVTKVKYLLSTNYVITMYCIDDHSAASINDTIAMKFHISVHVIYPQLCINVGTIGYF